MPVTRHLAALAWALLLVLLLPTFVVAAPLSQATQATLTVLDGSVTVVANASGTARPGATGDLLSEGDRILTGTPGRALVTLADGTETELDDGTEVRLEVLRQSPAGTLTVVGQSVGVTINRVATLNGASSYELSTPSATALVRGTEFRAQLVRDPQTHAIKEENIAVQQGVVEVRVREQQVTLQPGQRLRIERTPGGGLQTVESPPNVVPESGTIQTSRESGVPGGSLTASTPAAPANGTARALNATFDFSTGADVGSQNCGASGGLCRFGYGGGMQATLDGQAHGAAGSASLAVVMQADGRGSLSTADGEVSGLALALEGEQGGTQLVFAADPGAFERTRDQPLAWRGHGTWVAEGGVLDEGGCLRPISGSGTFEIAEAQMSADAVSSNPLRGTLTGTLVYGDCPAAPPAGA